MNNWNRDKYSKAWNFATLQHSGQTYGGTKPGMRIEYINHISSVAMELMWVFASSSSEYNTDLALQCALLHDTLEDTKATYEILEATFGKDVAEGVSALTKNNLLASKQEQMEDSLERILLQPKEIAMVKMADRITNLYHPPYYWSGNKIGAYLNEAQIIYNALHEADELLAARLEEKIKNYDQFLKR